MKILVSLKVQSWLYVLPWATNPQENSKENTICPICNVPTTFASFVAHTNYKSWRASLEGCKNAPFRVQDIQAEFSGLNYLARFRELSSSPLWYRGKYSLISYSKSCPWHGTRALCSLCYQIKHAMIGGHVALMTHLANLCSFLEKFAYEPSWNLGFARLPFRKWDSPDCHYKLKHNSHNAI